jgi:hypothetical protein
MSVQMVLLPVFVLVGLTFFLLLWMVTARTKAVKARETSLKDIAAGQPKYPARVAQIGNCFSNQFEVPLLFYFLIALALPLRRADLFIVLMSWVFVVTASPIPAFSSRRTTFNSAAWCGLPACWCCWRCGSTSR